MTGKNYSSVLLFLAAIFGNFVLSARALDLGCEEGWIQGGSADDVDLQQYCYKILGAEVRDNPQYISFYQCKQECNKLGGKLASIHSQAENMLIYRNLGNIYRGPPFRKTLIGLKDEKWLDGTEVDYTCLQQPCTKWNSPPEKFWDCAFIGGYSTGDLWFNGNCFDDVNKFDCACKKNAQ